MKQSALGLTLIELIITLLIVGIFTALAVPAMRDMIQNNRAVAFSADFMSALSLARSEAIKRGSGVSICAAGNSSQSTCAGTNNWDNGWVVFIDANEDGAMAAATDRIKIHPALEMGQEFTSANAFITFNSAGFLENGAGTYTLKATDCTGNNGRIITLSNTGRATVAATAC